jgi:uncharacterized membrane protein YhaH (DUF805 family)
MNLKLEKEAQLAKLGIEMCAPRRAFWIWVFCAIMILIAKVMPIVQFIVQYCPNYTKFCRFFFFILALKFSVRRFQCHQLSI